MLPEAWLKNDATDNQCSTPSRDATGIRCVSAVSAHIVNVDTRKSVGQGSVHWCYLVLPQRAQALLIYYLGIHTNMSITWPNAV